MIGVHVRDGALLRSEQGLRPVQVREKLRRLEVDDPAKARDQMGPCVLEVCQDGVGREAVGSLALDAVSRLGLPPVP